MQRDSVTDGHTGPGGSDVAVARAARLTEARLPVSPTRRGQARPVTPGLRLDCRALTSGSVPAAL